MAGALGLLAGSVSAAPPAAPPVCSVAGVDERCETWEAAFHEAELGATTGDFPSDLAVAPDGASVFVAAASRDASNPFDAGSQWSIAAYNAATGAESWRRHPAGMAHYALPTTIAASADGRFVIAAGTERASFSAAASRMVTIAFDAGTGAEVWRAVSDSSPLADGAMAVTAKDDAVYVTGYTRPEGAGYDYAIVAYDLGTGEQRWSARWAGVDDGRDDNPFELGTSPDGALVYVTGWSAGPGEFNNDYGTVAFRTRGEDAGQLAWEARFDGVGSHAPDQANDLAVGADGTVYVTGISDDVTSGPPFSVNYDIATVAYDGATGAQRWVTRHRWIGNTWNVGESIAVSGNRVVVGGLTYSSSAKDNDPVIVAYDAATGQVLWSAREALAQHEGEYGLDVVAADGAAYLVGVSGKSVGSVVPGTSGTVASQVTYAYDLAGGERHWIARYNTSGVDNVAGREAAVAPNGSRVFVLSQITRNADPSGNVYDVGLTAYETAL